MENGSDLHVEDDEFRAEHNVSAPTTHGCLSIVATPIGNLSDISPRARETLRGAQLIACEDTRRTGLLLHALGFKVALVSLHAHNESARVPELLTRLIAGARIALVSDAGMPGVSDPGGHLVSAAHAEGIRVEVIPGPSAVTAAIAAAGAPADRFIFAGFLPRKSGERTALFDRLDSVGWPVVAFESPHRLPGLLAELAARDPERRIAICREISKLYEQTQVGSVADLVAETTETPIRGEITLVLWPCAGQQDADAAEKRLEETIAALLNAGLSPGKAADLAAQIGAGARNAAYRTALAAAKRRAT